MKKALFAVVLSVLTIFGSAQSWADTLQLIEKAVERYKPTMPGCQLSISRNGQVIFSRAWGMADLEHNVPLTTGSVIEAGSVSKQFTAAAILLLEQQGKLTLQDDVRKYVPELPDYGTTITLRHLMQHTSGLKDWGAIAAINGWPRSTRTYNNDDALFIMSRQKTLNNIPGAEFIYSNSGYNLFALIVERVSGQSLAEFSRSQLFVPAGMTHTEWRDNFKKIVPNRAMAYEKQDSVYLADMPNEYVYGNGGLLTTTEDLLRWTNYIMNGKLGNPSLLPKQISTTPLNNGKGHTYAAGLFVDSLRGWRRIAHTGATASYRASLEHFPDAGLSFAWLSNSSEFDGAAGIPSLVRNIFLQNKTVPAGNTRPAAYPLSPDKMKIYTGWYRDPRTAEGLQLAQRNDSLYVGNNKLFPAAEHVFLSGTARLEIQPASRTLLLIQQGDTIIYTGAGQAAVAEKDLSEYTGTYRSEEAEATFRVLLRDGKLIVHQDPKRDLPLEPIYKDGFRFEGGNMYFERDEKGRIHSLKIFVSRARNVVFQKMAAAK